MPKCARSRCHIKLVNSVACPHCRAHFHVNCLPKHSPFCPHNPHLLADMAQPGSFIAPPQLTDPTPPSPNPANDLSPLIIADFGPPPGLPPNWDTMTTDQRSTVMMQTLTEVRHQNVQLQQSLTTVATKINCHSQLISKHDGDIHRISAEVSDMQQSLTDGKVKAQLIVSGLPVGFQQSPDDIANAIFTHLGLEDKFTAVHKGPSRLVNMKRPDPKSSSIIIRMLSHDACDIVLEAAARKRRGSKLLVKNIFGGEGEDAFYINKMQSPYVANLALQARQAKRRLGWRSVWVDNGNVCIKTTDQAQVISISLLSQLESLTR